MPGMIVAGLLALAALAFAAISGMNDGAALVAVNIPNAAFRPLVAVAVLALAVALVPLVGGALVAQTLAHGLASFEGGGGQALFLVAVLAAIGVVFALSRRGLPTSLTLALIGAIVGAAIGDALPVSWTEVAKVLVVGLLAPVLSGAVGLAVARAFVLVPTSGRAWTGLRRVGAFAFLAQSTAYGANDGQKMIAVFAIAIGLGPGGRVVVDPRSQLLLGGMFALGTLIGIDRYAPRLSRGIMPVRMLHSVAAELGSASAVFTSSLLGTPVSTTQSSTSALVGAGVSETIWRVRWEQAARIALAWVITLPAAALAGAAAAVLLGVAIPGAVST
jgi:PiT family inorganic phosphate transporter